jgi:hypothetical protein
MLDRRLPRLLDTTSSDQGYKQSLSKTVHELLDFFVKTTQYARQQAPESGELHCRFF